jgi:hypothetical protein
MDEDDFDPIDRTTIIGYCSYCKDAIYLGESHIVKVNAYGEEELLHDDCNAQSNTFRDELEF